MLNGWQRTIAVCPSDYAALEARDPRAIAAVSSMAPSGISMGEPQELVSEESRAALTMSHHRRTPSNEQLLLTLVGLPRIENILTTLHLKPGDIRGYLEANSDYFSSPENSVHHTAEQAIEFAKEANQLPVQPEHLLLALIEDQGPAGQVLRQYGLTSENLRQAIETQVKQEQVGQLVKDSEIKTLLKYGRDLTALAKENKLDPVIGREVQVGAMVEVLSRRTKNNPVLIGEPGVGKTAVVEGLAQRIIAGNVPKKLRSTRLIALDLNGMVAGAKYRGEFEERLQGVLKEITTHSDGLIVFVDELHTIIGAGAAEGSLDTANVIKPALARGELHLIGATTQDEYRKYIERDAALERRFGPITVPEPSLDEAELILEGIKPRFEQYHDVSISTEAVKAAVTLSSRYLPDRFLPDKAIDLIDQAAARVRIAHEANTGAPTEVRSYDIAGIVRTLTGVPVTEMESDERHQLAHLEEKLQQRVVGQDEATKIVSDAVRRSRFGLTAAQQPMAAFLFLGPTGVGKTELAKALAATVFGSIDALTRIDMSEYAESHTVARLIGSPPGYVGHEDGGQLTEAVRRKPYQVILLDEIEKAHPDVYDTLLQLLDEGRLTDGRGRTADFSNTIIIATSNLGAGEVPPAIGLTGENASTGVAHQEAAQQHFRPEFINRLDEIVLFEPLKREATKKIVTLQLRELAERTKAQGTILTWSPSLVKHLEEAGFSTEYGARELKRTIIRQVANPLASLLVQNEEQPKRVRAQVRSGTVILNVV